MMADGKNNHKRKELDTKLDTYTMERWIAFKATESPIVKLLLLLVVSISIIVSTISICISVTPGGS